MPKLKDLKVYPGQCPNKTSNAIGLTLCMPCKVSCFFYPFMPGVPPGLNSLDLDFVRPDLVPEGLQGFTPGDTCM